MKLLKESNILHDGYKTTFDNCEIEFNWPEEICLLGRRYDYVLFGDNLYYGVLLIEDLGNNIYKCAVDHINKIIIGKL